ncbi:hypothetical protein ACMYSK_03050 [Klebsiella sp. I138]
MATVEAWEKGYLFIFARPRPTVAKIQRVGGHASPIYKTAFLL